VYHSGVALGILMKTFAHGSCTRVGPTMQIWQRPDFVELCMNAEIGAYQEDTGEERDAPPSVGRGASNDGLDADASPSPTFDHVA
jgi:hypothetical protein